MRTLTLTPRTVDDPVAVYVGSYRPGGISQTRWETIRPFVTSQVLRLSVGVDTMKHCIRCLAHLASWCVDEHVTLDVDHVLDPDTVERYCVEGLRGTEVSLSTVRGYLRRLGRTLTETAPWEPPPTPLSRTKLPPPFTTGELALIERDIARQATELGRTTARALWLLGIGAGLDGRWNTKIAGPSVKKVGDLVVVKVPEPATRFVAVRAAYAKGVCDLAARSGEGLLVGDRKVSKNSSGEYSADIRIDGGRLVFSPARLRSTWLVAQIETGTQLPVLLAASGLKHVDSIRDLICYVTPRERRDAYGELAHA